MVKFTRGDEFTANEHNPPYTFTEHPFRVSIFISRGKEGGGKGIYEGSRSVRSKSLESISKSRRCDHLFYHRGWKFVEIRRRMDIVIKYKNVCSKREARSAKNSCAKTREDVSHHAVVLSSQQIGFRKLLSVSPKVEYLSFQWIFKTFVPFRITFRISRMDLSFARLW